MTITYVGKHREYDIYFDDHSEITGDTPRWLIDTGCTMISVGEHILLKDVLRWLDEM